MDEFLQRIKHLEEEAVNAKAQAAAIKEENLKLREEAIARDTKNLAKEREEEARRRTMQNVAGPVDTRMMNKPESFSGKDTDWPQFALLTRAYVGAISPRMYEILKMAEDPTVSIDRVDLEPGDDMLDTQLYYILTMLVKGNAVDKISLVEYGEGLCLWRLLVDEYEPKWKSRRTALHQSILNFQIGDDVLGSLDSFEKLIRQYKTVADKIVDDDTKPESSYLHWARTLRI